MGSKRQVAKSDEPAKFHFRQPHYRVAARPATDRAGDLVSQRRITFQVWSER
jgi:hypothetical protein